MSRGSLCLELLQGVIWMSMLKGGFINTFIHFSLWIWSVGKSWGIFNWDRALELNGIIDGPYFMNPKLQAPDWFPLARAQILLCRNSHAFHAVLLDIFA